VNAANRVVRDLVLDSLKYWSNEMGVDGFRFDLAAVLGNTQERHGFRFDKIPGDNILNRAAKEVPARGADGKGIELIAEPYALGDDSYQLGNFPTGWCEWNDRFRYPIRRSQNKLGIGGQEVTPAELIRHFAGSSDLFQPNGRKPYNGVNYVVAHDGFTLRDLYSYNDKRNNQPFPFGPSPGGSDNNISWDSGGDAKLQRQAARNGLALVLVSGGVPMMVGGDEMYRAQFGNNNPFNLDNKKCRSTSRTTAGKTTSSPPCRPTCPGASGAGRSTRRPHTRPRTTPSTRPSRSAPASTRSRPGRS
jgi:glycogen operon protein